MNRTGSTHTKAEKTPENTSTRELKTYLKVTSTDLKTCLLLQMQKQQCKTITNMSISPPEDNNPAITDHKGKNLADKRIQDSCSEETQQATRKYKNNSMKTSKKH